MQIAAIRGRTNIVSLAYSRRDSGDRHSWLSGYSTRFFTVVDLVLYVSGYHPTAAVPTTPPRCHHAAANTFDTSRNSVLSALASLHAQGLFHGHVTPGRILFSSPSRNELGAATAKLCYLEKAHGAGDAWQAGGAPVGAVDKDLR